jgi:hypothetical protein
MRDRRWRLQLVSLGTAIGKISINGITIHRRGSIWSLIRKGEAGLNPYACTDNNPVMNTDSTGLLTGLDDFSLGQSFGSPDLNLSSAFNQQLSRIQGNVSQLDLSSTLALNSSYKTSGTNYLPYKQYSSVEAADVASIMYANPTSIARNQEYGGLIYASTSPFTYFKDLQSESDNGVVLRAKVMSLFYQVLIQVFIYLR